MYRYVMVQNLNLPTNYEVHYLFDEEGLVASCRLDWVILQKIPQRYRYNWEKKDSFEQKIFYYKNYEI
jgi:hypothetical protein